MSRLVWNRFRNIYIHIYAKAVKATWERIKIKAYRVHIYFHWVEQLIGSNQWLRILISELEYVDLWITCVLIHCFTGGSHCPGWCGPEVHPSLPGSRMPVLRILTVDEKFGLGYSDARKIELIEIKEHLIKITPKLIIDHLSCTISIASNGRIPGFFFTALIVKRVWLIGTPEYVVGECQAISCQSDTDWLPDCVNGGGCTLLINFTLCWLTAISAWMRDFNHYNNHNKNVSSLLMDWNNVSFAVSDQCNVVSRPQRVNIVVGSLGFSELIYLWDL